MPDELLGTLAAGLVHEIKNPLSTLAINLTLLKEDLEAALPDDRMLRRRVEILQQEAQRLESVLADFLRFAGRRKLDRKRQDLAEVAEAMVEFVRPGFERDGVRIALSTPPLVVDLDAPLMKQALLNVLLNAQQAMEGGGRISVTGAAEDGFARLVVEDDGRGIRPEDLPRVFDAYFSASRSGSGLGLPTAKRIVEDHGGAIAIDSQPGRGTRVVLRLPLAEGA